MNILTVYHHISQLFLPVCKLILYAFMAVNVNICLLAERNFLQASKSFIVNHFLTVTASFLNKFEQISIMLPACDIAQI